MRMGITTASLGLASAAAIFLLAWPMYSAWGGGRPTQATLLQVNGFQKQIVRIIVALIMLVFRFISGFTIGLFFVPAAIAMLLACMADSTRAANDH
jgi:hypothetical protein